MARHYQPKKKNPFRLPHNVYMQCYYAVKDYERVKSERLEVLHGSSASYSTYTQNIGGKDVECRQYGLGSGRISDTTADKAERLVALSAQCEDVEQAIIQVPDEYRKGVLDGILYGCGYPCDADPETYRRWRRKFLFFVAKNKKML